MLRKNKKIFVTIIIAFTIIFTISIFEQIYYFDQKSIANIFEVDAVYYEDKKYVEITFDDKSQKSSSITLEILGMPKSYHKIFTKPSFIDRVNIDSIPQYGWKSMPVTFVVDHEDFGMIGIKMEIHPQNDPKKNVIFSRL